MSFPWTIKYSNRLDRKLSDDEVGLTLGYIGQTVERESGEDIVVDGNELTFKSSFFSFRWNWNIMVPIEKGKFVLTTINDQTVLTYEIFMYRFFIITAIMAVVIGLVSGQVGVGIFGFTFLFGFNWILAVMRHKGLLSDIAIEINDRLKN